MSKEFVKSISSEVSKEVWKRLRVLAIQKELTLPKLIQEILEKHVNQKRYENLDSPGISES
jgi:hypothetical protein